MKELNENELQTNNKITEMVLDVKINSIRNKLISKINSLKNELEHTLEMMEKVDNYKLNSLGIIQSEGQEIDVLCGKLGILYEIKDVITGRYEI